MSVDRPIIPSMPPCLGDAKDDTTWETLGGRVAAPSCVLPAGLAENARFLAGKTAEVGLCLFETQACCAYGPEDLPPDLAKLPLRWHAHLPVDLPWSCKDKKRVHSAQPAAQAALAVLDKVIFLRPRLAVLHAPNGSPDEQRRKLDMFLTSWKRKTSIPLVLENTADCDVISLGANFLRDYGLGFCLDVGHLLGYGQQRLLSSDLPEQATLLHWSAPGDGDRHLSLTALTPSQDRTLTALAKRLPPSATHLIEVFSWQSYMTSLPVLANMLRDA